MIKRVGSHWIIERPLDYYVSSPRVTRVYPKTLWTLEALCKHVATLEPRAQSIDDLREPRHVPRTLPQRLKEGFRMLHGLPV